MRDRARQRALAAARSRHASPEELKEASKRVKEIEQELLQMDLLPETRQGESRLQRYRRLLRIRSMREEFGATRQLEEPRPLNSLLLSLVMLVAAISLCAFCAGGVLAGVQILRQKPDPMAAASGFWDNMIARQYPEVVANYLSPTLRVQYSNGQFEQIASTADTNYGPVTAAQLLGQSGDMTQTAVLQYLVTRGAHTTYKDTIVLVLHGGSWGVDDLGSTVDPHAAGLPEPTATPSPTGVPTATPATPEITPSTTPSALVSPPLATAERRRDSA